MAFKAILDEVDQLHDVGERLEELAEQHRPVSEALVNIAGNVRNIATVLAVRVDLAAEKSRDSHAALESLVLQRTAALRALSSSGTSNPRTRRDAGLLATCTTVRAKHLLR